MSDTSDTGHRTPDTGHRTPDTGHRTACPSESLKGRTRTDGRSGLRQTVREPARTVNPFRARIAERRRRLGGQFASPPTDRLSDAVESLLAFEAERAELANAIEVQPW